MTAMLSGAGGPAAGGWLLLVDVSIKTAIVLVLALAVTSALQRSSASVRHHVWTLAFVASLSMPALVSIVPPWRVSVPGWTTTTAAIVTSEAARSVADRRVASLEAGAPVLPAAASNQAAAGPPPTHRGGASPGSILLALWAIGAACLLVKLAVGVVSAWWTSRVASVVSNPAWIETVDELRTEMAIQAPVRILRSDWVGSPMAWGIFRTSLLLPVEAEAWGAERRRAVALHELAHIKRRDCLTHLLAQAARAIHWFNPLAWLASRRLRAERERACDDLVITAGTRSSDYARLLLDVARSRGDRRLSWAAVSMSGGSELEGRLLAILDPSRDRRGAGRPGAITTGLLFACLVLPLAAFRAAPLPPPTPATPGAGVAVPASPDGVPAPVATPSLPGSPDRTPRASLSVPVPRPLARAEGRAVVDGRPVPEAPYPRFERLSAPAPAISDTVDQRVVDALVRALENERASIRSQAARALGHAEAAAAAQPLSATLQRDESAQVRSQAAWALGMIESPEGVPALGAALGDEDAQVRSQAAWALGMIESPDGVDPLLRGLADESVEVRSQSAWALGMIESDRAVDGLVRALRADASTGVRSQIAWALGMIESDAATDALIDAIEDESEEVARKAMWALGRVLGG